MGKVCHNHLIPKIVELQEISEDGEVKVKLVTGEDPGSCDMCTQPARFVVSGIVKVAS